jgi:hypothetical protein
MSKNRTGNFIAGGKPQIPSLSLNNGVFDTNEVYESVGSNKWQSAGSGAFEIARSLRFRRSATARLSRTLTTTSNRRTFTQSLWIKLGALNSGGSDNFILIAFPGGNTKSYLVRILDDGRLRLSSNIEGVVAQWNLTTVQVFRDPSAWYHIVVAMDTTQAVESNRLKLYINGNQVTAFTDISYPSLNFDNMWNDTAATQQIGRDTSGTFDGCMAELNFIDGQQLEPSAFGYFDPITNIWQPKRYTGTYGTNGLYLPFTENQNTQALGRNFAGGTNFIKNSQNFADSSGTGWQKVRSSVTANAGIAPDGTNTATKFFEDTSNGSHDLNLADPAGGITFGTPYCFSFYAKSTGENRDQISYNLVNNGYTSVIQWYGQVAATQAGQAGIVNSGGAAGGATQTGYGSQHVGNGWYRFWGSGILAQGASSTFNVTLSLSNTSGAPNGFYTGNGSSGILIWGAMVNQGTTPDAYVPTTGSILNTNWTPNNFSVTAGATYDSMVDSPTNVFTTANDTGGVVPGNYATVNPLSNFGTCSNGNLTISVTGQPAQPATIFQSTGKWYWEVLWVSGSNYRFGVTNEAGVGQDFGLTANGWCKINSPPRTYNSGSAPSYGTDGSVGDTYMFALDLDAGRIWYGINGTWQASGNPATNSNPSQTFTANQSMSPAFASGTGTLVYSPNFGQRPFAYTPPAGFRSLNTTNIQTLGTSTIGNAAITPYKYFDTTIYAGLGTNRDVKNSGFQPDFVWLKVRGDTDSHGLFDSVRGAGARLQSNDTGTESQRLDVLTSFNSDGFSISGNDLQSNAAGKSYVAWQWKAGDSTVTNTAGSVTSRVRTNPTTGFSIATYTSPSSGSFTFGHGLSVAPSFFILKERGATSNWIVWTKYYGSPTNQGLYLNSMSTFSAGSNWLTGVNNSTIGITQGQVTSGVQDHVVYSFAEIPGFSKVGSYVGNGSSDGPFVYTGFRPEFIIYKRINTANGHWGIADSVRSRSNVVQSSLYPNLNNAGGETDADRMFDFVSNGFKIRTTSGSFESNGNGSIYIYMAFAESPFALNNRAR